MDEFLDRLKRSWSRIGLRDRTTAITAASIVIVLALIAVAFQAGSDDTEDLASEARSQTSDPDLGGGPFSGDTDAPLATRPGASTDRGTGRVTAPEGAPSDVPPGAVPKDVAITDEVIKVGLFYISDAGAANAAAGFGNVGQVNPKRAWDAMVREVNKNPPFGRKVVPVYHSMTTDEYTSKGSERANQEMCAKWTQDDKVFAAWESSNEGLNQCLTKAGVPQIGLGAGSSWSKTYKDFPYLVEPSDAALDRVAEFEVDQLVKQNFFKEFKANNPPYTPQKPADGKARIALIRYDQPSYDAAAAAMKKRLATHGLSLCSGCEFEIGYSSDNVQAMLDDATEINAAIQNCKSRPDGPCTHMLFLGSTNGVRITIFFLDGAEKQAYRPRLGFNPLDAPTAAVDFLGSPSHPQMRDSVIVADGPDEFGVRTDRFEECKDIMEKAGEDFSGDEGVNKLDQIGFYCDIGWYFQAALRQAGRTLTRGTFLDAVNTLPAVPSAQVFLMRTKLGRHDGSSAIRAGEWDEGCNCRFKPVTPITPV